MAYYDPEEVLSSRVIKRGQREWIDRFPSVRRLALAVVGRRRRGSPSTVALYVLAVKRFVEWAGYDGPEELLEDIRAGEVDVVELLDRTGDGFIDSLLGKGLAPKTVNSYVMGVKRWLSINDVTVDWDRVETPQSVVVNVDRAPSREELQRMLDHCMQVKDRVALLVLSSSGLRVGTFLSLTWGDVDFSYPDVAKITVRRAPGRKFGGKGASVGGRLYVTWISPEAKQALLEYKRHREAQGETITPESPLYASNTGGFMSMDGFTRRYYLVLKRAGLLEKGGSRYLLHPHTLRKYFRSRCIGVDESIRESWMGHRGGYLDESYFRPEEERHLEEYRRALPHLMVYPNPLEFEAKLEEKLKEARREAWEREARLANLEKKIEVLSRALEHPKIGPLLWKALEEIEEEVNPN